MCSGAPAVLLWYPKSSDQIVKNIVMLLLSCLTSPQQQTCWVMNDRLSRPEFACHHVLGLQTNFTSSHLLTLLTASRLFEGGSPVHSV